MSKPNTQTIYDGDVVLERDARHRYTLRRLGETHPNTIVPSVTGIVGLLDKPFLRQWTANECAKHVQESVVPGQVLDEVQVAQLTQAARYAWKQKRDRAQTVGSIVHDWAEEFIGRMVEGQDAPELPVAPQARTGVEAFLRWWESAGLEPLAVERMAFHPGEMYVGTFDLLAKSGDRTILVDYKTGSGVYEEHHFQTAAYVLALEEEGIAVDQRLLVHLDRDSGLVTPHALDGPDGESKGRERNLAVFLGLRGAYRGLKGL